MRALIAADHNKGYKGGQTLQSPHKPGAVSGWRGCARAPALKWATRGSLARLSLIQSLVMIRRRQARLRRLISDRFPGAHRGSPETPRTVAGGCCCIVVAGSGRPRKVDLCLRSSSASQCLTERTMGSAGSSEAVRSETRRACAVPALVTTTTTSALCCSRKSGNLRGREARPAPHLAARPASTQARAHPAGSAHWFH